MKYPIFYYWIKNITTKEITKVVSLDYCGDIGDPCGKDCIIIDWTYEMIGEVMC